jgi:hypothetical protein
MRPFPASSDTSRLLGARKTNALSLRAQLELFGAAHDAQLFDFVRPRRERSVQS